jgi:pentapeptide MXKDX repeat protein
MSQRSISGLAVTIGAALVLTATGAFAQTASIPSEAPMHAESAHDAMKPEAAKPDAMKPDAMKASAAKPDAMKPDAMKAIATKPDAMKPDAMKPETATHAADPTPVAIQKR